MIDAAVALSAATAVTQTLTAAGTAVPLLLLLRLPYSFSPSNAAETVTLAPLLIFTPPSRNPPCPYSSLQLRNPQSTNSGFGHVSQENVFKVCDQPHPHKLRKALDQAREGNTHEAMDVVMALWQVRSTHALHCFSAVFWCFPVIVCCWLLLAAVDCCWLLLLAAIGCCLCAIQMSAVY
jgi:hypothetical protein